MGRRTRAGARSALLAAALVAVAASPLLAREVEPPMVTVRPSDTGETLVNPAMGWVLHYYDNVPANYGSRLAPSDTVDEFPGLSVAYLRIPWSYIEPEEGQFRWDTVDGPAQRWIAKGKQVAFRFSCSESWTRYATPEWVQRAGAKGYDFEPGVGLKEGGPFWEPDYDDPVFLAKLDAFLAAAAARYDGDPTVAFIDVGSFGVWGEGHLWASTQKTYPASTVIRHIDLHRKHFPRTLLAANDDFSFQGDETIAYALENGLTLRDDSILVQPKPNSYFHAEMAQPFWPRTPVILESEHYGGSVQRGAWEDGSLYERAMEEYHASYVSIHWWPREFLEPERALIERMNLRLGYRLHLVEASWPASVRLGDALPFRMAWRNAGVAPCYPGGHPAFTLKDADGGIVTVAVDEGFDMRDLPVGPPGAAETRDRTFPLLAPFYLRPGRYDVFVSIGSRSGTPRIALPLAEDDGQHRYRLGSVEFVGDYSVRAGVLTRRGEEWYLPLTWSIRRALAGGVRPFCHFGEGERIDFQGTAPETELAGEPWKQGEAQVGVSFAAPGPGEWEVTVGLWDPERLAQPDERLLPDVGDGTRRVRLGRLRVSPDGTAALVADL